MISVHTVSFEDIIVLCVLVYKHVYWVPNPCRSDSDHNEGAWSGSGFESTMPYNSCKHIQSGSESRSECPCKWVWALVFATVSWRKKVCPC